MHLHSNKQMIYLSKMKKLSIAFLLFLVACEMPTPSPAISPSPTPTPSVEVKPSPITAVAPKLSWDNDVRKAWSEYLYNEMLGLLPTYDKAKDATKFCTNYNKLSDSQKAHMWSEMWVWVAYYESGWNPKTKYFEKTMGYYSEGLLQLSYVDKKWATYCKFPVKQDEKESILDPYINLHCGINIMAKQIERKGAVLLESGVYWAVLKINGKYTKIDKITSKTQSLTFCSK